MILQDRQAHERADSAVRIPRALDLTSDARVDADKMYAVRDRYLFPHGMGLAKQGKEVAPGTHCAGDLVHDAAGRADHVVFHLLGKDGQRHPLQVDPVEQVQSMHGRDFQRGRRGCAYPERYVASQHDRGAVGESFHMPFALQHAERPGNVGRPGGFRHAGETPFYGIVVHGARTRRQVVERQCNVWRKAQFVHAGAVHDHLPVIPGLKAHQNGTVEGHLADQRTAVVRDAAHAVEPRGRPDDVDRFPYREARPQRAERTLRRAGQGVLEGLRVGGQVSTIRQAIQHFQ